MKKKLSIIAYSMVGGGAERVVSVLLDGLKNDFDIKLVLMRDKIDYVLPDDIEVYFLENSTPSEHGVFKLLKLPLLAWKYKRFCQKNDIEISMSFTTRPAYLSILSKLFGNHCSIVINESTTPSMMYGNDRVVSKINKFLIKHLYPHSDSIISNSEGGKIDLIQNFMIDTNQIKTIYNPCDLVSIRDKSHSDASNGLSNNFNFISAGRLDGGKNHELLIRAFSKIADKSSHLYILGEGDLKKHLEHLIKNLHLEERVFLLGFDANPYKYFAKADAFVFSSNYEGFPVVLIEALTCGLPVISTDCKSGPRELLSPKSDVGMQLEETMEVAEFGILTPVGNEELLTQAMDTLMGDVELQKELRRRSQERVESFNQVNIVPLFKNILNQSRL